VPVESGSDAVVGPPTGSRHLSAGVWLAAVVGVVFRAVWVLGVARIPTGLSDPFLYRAYGIAIASGAGYESLVGEPTAYYPPGYPFLVGSVYWVGEQLGVDGFPTWPLGLVQSLLWGVAILAVGALGSVLAGRNVGVVAAVLLACWPNLIAYSAAILSESAFVAASACAVLGFTMLGRSPEQRQVPWLFLTGAASALAVALRPQFLAVVVVVVAIWLLWRVPGRTVFRSVLSIAVGLLVVLGPWVARNAETLGAATLSTNTGDNLCIGAYPGARGGFAIAVECQSGQTWYDGVDGELAQDAYGRSAARRYLLDDPLRWALLAPRKLFYTYLSDDDGLAAVEAYGANPLGSGWFRTGFVVVANAFYAMVGISGLIGLGLVGRNSWRTRSVDRAAFVGAAVASLLVPVLFFGDPRFKVSAAPLVAVGAAVALSTAWGAIRSRQAGP
jgi:4-amino-4-deoxy-L-arabinose transferase-like glycosyltransferase